MIDVKRLDRAVPQAWRNGGGQTRELLAWPNAGDWSLRISVADITHDGPFSSFPGVERWFAVIEGAGVLLRFAAHHEVASPDTAPLHFDGAAAPGCELLDGATRDLNLMVRRDRGRAAMQRVVPDVEWLTTAPLRALFCTGPARLQIDDTDAARLPAMALAWSDHGTRQRWRVIDDGAPSNAWWLSFQPHAS